MGRCRAARLGFLVLTIGVLSGVGVLHAESTTGPAESSPSATSSTSAQDSPSASATPAPTGSEPTPVPPTQMSLAEVESISLDVLHDQFLSEEPLESALELRWVRIDELGMGHTRVRQTYAGIPVLFGESTVHLRPDGSLRAVTGKLFKGIKIDPVPALSPSEAVETAELADRSVGIAASPSTAELIIYTRDKKPRLAYEVTLGQPEGATKPERQVYFIDAHTGETLYSYLDVQAAATTGSGTGNYYTTSSLYTYKWDGTTGDHQYYLQDIGSTSSPIRKISTLYQYCGYGTNNWTDADNVWGGSSATQKLGVDAHYTAYQTFTYYWSKHSRQGMDYTGGYQNWSYAVLDASPYQTSTIGIRVLLDSGLCSYTNNHTLWDGTYVNIGDGDAYGGPSTVLDIVGHEWTHGIIQHEAIFWNADEPGALRESWCDVFGEMVESYANPNLGDDEWKIGAFQYDPVYDAWRYMDRPHDGYDENYTLDDAPDHYSERYAGTSDNGGVHHNAGISNLAFKLLAAGGEPPYGDHPCPYPLLAG